MLTLATLRRQRKAGCRWRRRNAATGSSRPLDSARCGRGHRERVLLGERGDGVLPDRGPELVADPARRDRPGRRTPGPARAAPGSRRSTGHRRVAAARPRGIPQLIEPILDRGCPGRQARLLTVDAAAKTARYPVSPSTTTTTRVTVTPICLREGRRLRGLPTGRPGPGKTRACRAGAGSEIDPAFGGRLTAANIYPNAHPPDIPGGRIILLAGTRR